MRRTKILATVGPATSSAAGLANLIRAGADCFRLNFSHGSDAEHRMALARMRAVRDRLHRELAIVADVQGPKLRIGRLNTESVRLTDGAYWTLDESVEAGDLHRVGVRVPDLAHAARPGDPILLGDGGIELTVVRVDHRGIQGRVVHGGVVRSHAGLFLPRAHLRTRVLGRKDLHDVEIAVAGGVDFLAVSFVRDARDLRLARATLDRHRGGDRVKLIAKIERAAALDSYDEILAASDAIMVARGDLGIEVPLERLPLIQKELIQKANSVARPVIVATQMLLSMVHAPRPTRAEATDVANAVLDGADAVMLSEESAIGEYPDAAVRWLARIAETTERELLSPSTMAPVDGLEVRSSPDRAVAAAAVQLARDLRARAILTPTHSGRTATLVSSLRPREPIIALCASPDTRRQLALVWGVESRAVPPRLLLTALRVRAIEIGRAIDPSAGRVILTAGYPVEGRPTNLVTVVDVPPRATRPPSRSTRPNASRRGGRGGPSRGRRTTAAAGTRS